MLHDWYFFGSRESACQLRISSNNHIREIPRCSFVYRSDTRSLRDCAKKDLTTSISPSEMGPRRFMKIRKIAIHLDYRAYMAHHPIAVDTCSRRTVVRLTAGCMDIHTEILLFSSSTYAPIGEGIILVLKQDCESNCRRGVNVFLYM